MPHQRGGDRRHSWTTQHRDPSVALDTAPTAAPPTPSRTIPSAIACAPPLPPVLLQSTSIHTKTYPPCRTSQ
jgi:hypothetical protein